MADKKVCAKCGRELPLAKFYTSRSQADGYSACCRGCYTKGLVGNECYADIRGFSKGTRAVSDGSCSRNWAAEMKTKCRHRDSGCWLNKQLGLCCSECLGRAQCVKECKCKNTPDKCNT